MRTVEFVRRLASVSVSDTVSFVDNLMKICEARTSVVYSLRTDTHDLPSTHSPVLDDDADAVESTSTSTATASIINVVVAAVSSSSLAANKCAASIDDTHALPPIHLGRTIIRLRDGLLRFATTDTQALNLLIISLASFIHPSQVANLHLRKLCLSTVDDFICRPILMMISRSNYIPFTSLSLSHSQQATNQATRI